NLADDFDFNQTPRPPLLLSTHPKPGPPSTPPPGEAPAVQTEGASAVTQTTATLHAGVSPNEGEVSDCHSEYGTGPTYGHSAPCASSPGSRPAPLAASPACTPPDANTSNHTPLPPPLPAAPPQPAPPTTPPPPEAPAVQTEGASAVTQ